MAAKNLETFITSQLAWLGQSGFKIRSGSGNFLYIDPFKIPAASESADLILISHPHHDHFNPKVIDALEQNQTVIVTPGSMEQSGTMGLAAGKTIQIGPFRVTGVPAYNLKKQFHPRNSYWLGYIVEVDGVKLYHAGDTDFIPEMKDLQPDIALLPVGGLFTMNAKAAVLAAEAMKSKVVIPMHYGFIPLTGGAGKRFAKLWGGETKVLTRKND